MIKKLLVLLTTIVSAIVLTTADSINAMDLRENFYEAVEAYVKEGKCEWQYTLGPAMDNAEILKAKYDLVFKDGKAMNDKYFAIVDSNYNIKVYKKKKALKRQEEFSTIQGE